MWVLCLFLFVFEMPESLTHNPFEVSSHNHPRHRRSSDCLRGFFNCGLDAEVKCIIPEWVCDNESDCADGSDERDCIYDNPLQYRKCGYNPFMCKSGVTWCVSDDSQCDQQDDCDDGSDEFDCHGRVHVPTALAACGHNPFNCTSGITFCVGRHELCDQWRDCEDGSDESECRGNTHLPSARAACAPTTFICTVGLPTCINQNASCDGHMDCEDGSDENQLCGACEHFGCAHTCTDAPNGPKCSCGQGELLESNGRTCRDIDECSEGLHACDQLCVNELATHHCTCLTGFQLLSDNVTCELEDKRTGIIAVLTEKQVLFTQLPSAYYNSHLPKSIKLPESMGQPQHASLMAGRRDNPQLVVSALKQGHTGSLWLVGGQQESQRLINNIPGLNNVQVDGLTGNIYYTAGGTGVYSGVSVCSQNGRFCHLLVDDEGLSNVSGLALDERRARMFWTSQTQSNTVIWMASMDGSNTKLLLSGNVSAHTDLVYDPARNRLYLSNTAMHRIESIDIGKSNPRLEKVLQIASYHSLTSVLSVFDHHAYWIKPSSRGLMSEIIHPEQLYSYPTSGKTFDSKPLALMVDHISLHQQIELMQNPCTSAGCTHLCVLSWTEGALCAKCVCPNGYVPSLDHQCTPQSNTSLDLLHLHAPVMADKLWVKLCLQEEACYNGGKCQLREHQLQTTPHCHCQNGSTGIFCEVDVNGGSAVSQGESMSETYILISVLILSAFIVVLAVVFIIKYKHRLCRSTLKLKTELPDTFELVGFTNQNQQLEPSNTGSSIISCA